MPRSRISITRLRLRAGGAARSAAASSSLAQRLRASAAACPSPPSRRARRAGGRSRPRSSSPALRLLAHLDVVVVVLLGAVGEPVADRLGVRPQPRDRPQQAAEHQRQQAQRVDRVLLRMMPLLGALLRHHVHHPEQHDDNDRHDAEHQSRCSPRPCRAPRRTGTTRAPKAGASSRTAAADAAHERTSDMTSTYRATDTGASPPRCRSTRCAGRRECRAGAARASSRPGRGSPAVHDRAVRDRELALLARVELDLLDAPAMVDAQVTAPLARSTTAISPKEFAVPARSRRCPRRRRAPPRSGRLRRRPTAARRRARRRCTGAYSRARAAQKTIDPSAACCGSPPGLRAALHHVAVERPGQIGRGSTVHGHAQKAGVTDRPVVAPDDEECRAVGGPGDRTADAVGIRRAPARCGRRCIEGVNGGAVTEVGIGWWRRQTRAWSSGDHPGSPACQSPRVTCLHSFVGRVDDEEVLADRRR